MMWLQLTRLLAVSATLFAFCFPARSETLLAQQDLYLDALRSISEGRQTDASEALIRMIEQEPQHAGAWLDLAIIQCELGRGAEAERLFQTIENRFSPPPVIQAVIESQRAKGCKAWEPQGRTSVLIGRGVDSNVNQGASSPNFTVNAGEVRVDLQLLPENLPQKDSYTVASAEYIRDLTPNGTIGFVHARAVRNDSLSKYNTSTLIGGIEHPWRAGDWRMRGTGLVILQGLGGTLYQTQAQAQIRVTPPLKLPPGLELSAVGGVSHIQYPTLQEFNSNMIELRSLATYRTGNTLLQASLGYLSDHASGARPGGDRAGWLAAAYGRKQLASGLVGELGWTRQTWLSDLPYAPGFINTTRDQRTQVWRAALSYPIADRQFIQLEVRRVSNLENISIFQYTSRQIQLSWQWQNF